MVVDSPKLSDAEVDRIFRALADATRRDIVRRTLAGEASVSELAAAYDMSWAAVQKHVAVLEGAALVTKEARGRERIVRGKKPYAVAAAAALLLMVAGMTLGQSMAKATFDRAVNPELDAALKKAAA